MYVDDVLTEADNVEALIRTKEELVHILNLHGLNGIVITPFWLQIMTKK